MFVVVKLSLSQSSVDVDGRRSLNENKWPLDDFFFLFSLANPSPPLARDSLLSHGNPTIRTHAEALFSSIFFLGVSLTLEE